MGGFPGGSMVKNPPANAGDLGSIPGSRRPPGGGHGNPTLVFLPAEFHGQRSLMGYSPWSRKKSDTIERQTLELIEPLPLTNSGTQPRLSGS